MRKIHSASFKGKVALEALKEVKTMNELSSEFEIHRALVQNWKKELKEAIPTIFNTKKSNQVKESEKLVEELYRQIGMLKVENDWLKKKFDS